MNAPSTLKECPEGCEECTFGELQIGDEFIDPQLPHLTMIVHIASGGDRLAGEYFKAGKDKAEGVEAISHRFAGGHNKRVFRKKK